MARLLHSLAAVWLLQLAASAAAAVAAANRPTGPALVEQLGTVLVPAPDAAVVVGDGGQSVVAEVEFPTPFAGSGPPLVVVTPFFRTLPSQETGPHGMVDDEDVLVFAASTVDVTLSGFKIYVDCIQGDHVRLWRDAMVLVSWIAWDPGSFPPAAGGMGSQGGQVPVSPEPDVDFAGDVVIEFNAPFQEPPVVIATARAGGGVREEESSSFALTLSKVTATYAVLNVYNLGEPGSWTDLIHVDWRAWSLTSSAGLDGSAPGHSNAGLDGSAPGHSNCEAAWTFLADPQATIGLSRAFRSEPIVLASVLNAEAAEEEGSLLPSLRRHKIRAGALDKKRAPPKSWDTYVPTLHNVTRAAFAVDVARVYQTTLWKNGVRLGWVAQNATRVCLDDCLGHGVCVQGRCECDPGWTGANTCDVCKPGYWGAGCLPCAGLNESAANGGDLAHVCSGHGVCDGSGTTQGTGACLCEGGYAGDDCGACAEGFYPDLTGSGLCGVCPNADNVTCSGHGSCEVLQRNDTQGDYHVCVCEGAWAGVYCAVCQRGYAGEACNVPCPSLCSGRGECVLDDGLGAEGQDGEQDSPQPVCECDEGWDNASLCQLCAVGYYGPGCQGRCPDCGLHGRCDDGLTGSGNCSCEAGYEGDRLCQTCNFGYFLNPGANACLPCPGGAENPCSGHSDPPWQCPNGLCLCTSGYHGADCSVLDKERGWIVVLVILLACAMLLGLVGLALQAYRKSLDVDESEGRHWGQGGLLGGRKRSGGRRRSSQGLDPALRKKLLEQCPDVQDMEKVLSSLQSDAADWIIDFDKLELGTRIGAGNSSCVYRGLYFDELVAIKKLQVRQDPDMFGLFFKQEAELLSKVHHPHVVRFYGVAVHQGDFYIVTEFCDSSLHRLLQQHHAQGNKLELEDLYRLAFQVANGMAYLHARSIVHRDLKPENILVNEKGDAKIADFGLSRFLAKGQPLLTVQVGTPAYMCPEMAHGTTDMGASVDVYSFGVLLWALWVCQPPYFWLDVTPVQLLSRVVAGLRPRTDPSMPKELVGLMEACWQEDPARRPTFDALVIELRQLLKTHLDVRRRSFAAASVYSPPLSPYGMSASASSSSFSLSEGGGGGGGREARPRPPEERRPLLHHVDDEGKEEGDGSNSSSNLWTS